MQNRHRTLLPSRLRRSSFAALHIAALALPTGLWGCVPDTEPSVEVPPPPPVPTPSPVYETELFSEVVRSYTASIQLLKRVPPDEEYNGIRRAIDLLADAVEAIPNMPEPAGEQAARMIRNDWVVSYFRVLDEPRPSAAAKQALLTAAGAFDLAASGPYRGSARLRDELAQFRRSVEVLNPQKSLLEQRPALLGAMEQARDVLVVIQQQGPSAGPISARR